MHQHTFDPIRIFQNSVKLRELKKSVKECEREYREIQLERLESLLPIHNNEL